MPADTTTAPEQVASYVAPTLLIGLGGSGKDVLLRVRRMFYERHGKRADGSVGFPVVCYLALDTDPGAFERLEGDSPSDFVLRNIQFKRGGTPEAIDCTVEPRQLGTRAFGRAVPGIDVRVVDDADRDIADGQPGEMLVRHSEQTPRRGCFSGYFKDAAATEAAWRGGWFHTGDVVWRGPDGMLHFVERKKNIIRRSGENIAAAEVEAVLLTHPDVQQAAVMAIKDELREEEVLACVVLKRELPHRDVAMALFEHCNERLAYYKAPGWVAFGTALPLTPTLKLQRADLKKMAEGLLGRATTFDTRGLKKRDAGG